ncbi:hypothetical protein D5R81_13110 [Parashewanella spongiae]|uniref:Uncharacterized protein n=1 Tax=Parashewanella spongiae TaxID=342950 RepID=A0A3A6TTY2_9GAMM|nr:hypothetical protein [Parashewanella spongiae]MCL1080153.1 hypothetical protein [Parashewanella spongiae]RJY11488.1 hypothetical protein D5R81_13110 [Parashewanella spongiae]
MSNVKPSFASVPPLEWDTSSGTFTPLNETQMTHMLSGLPEGNYKDKKMIFIVSSQGGQIKRNIEFNVSNSEERGLNTSLSSTFWKSTEEKQMGIQLGNAYYSSNFRPRLNDTFDDYEVVTAPLTEEENGHTRAESLSVNDASEVLDEVVVAFHERSASGGVHEETVAEIVSNDQETRTSEPIDNRGDSLDTEYHDTELPTNTTEATSIEVSAGGVASDSPTLEQVKSDEDEPEVLSFQGEDEDCEEFEVINMTFDDLIAMNDDPKHSLSEQHLHMFLGGREEFEKQHKKEPALSNIEITQHLDLAAGTSKSENGLLMSTSDSETHSVEQEEKPEVEVINLPGQTLSFQERTTPTSLYIQSLYEPSQLWSSGEALAQELPDNEKNMASSESVESATMVDENISSVEIDAITGIAQYTIARKDGVVTSPSPQKAEEIQDVKHKHKYKYKYKYKLEHKHTHQTNSEVWIEELLKNRLKNHNVDSMKSEDSVGLVMTKRMEASIRKKCGAEHDESMKLQFEKGREIQKAHEKQLVPTKLTVAKLNKWSYVPAARDPLAPKPTLTKAESIATVITLNDVTKRLDFAANNLLILFCDDTWGKHYFNINYGKGHDVSPPIYSLIFNDWRRKALQKTLKIICLVNGDANEAMNLFKRLGVSPGKSGYGEIISMVAEASVVKNILFQKESHEDGDWALRVICDDAAVLNELAEHKELVGINFKGFRLED